MTPSSEVLIIGAGPAGLSVAASLQKEQVLFDLIDRTGKAGGAYLHIYDEIVLASPTRFTALPGQNVDFPNEYIPVSAYRRYLIDYAERRQLTPQKAEIAHIERQHSGFQVKISGQNAPLFYRAVVIATGMFDFPVYPTIPGLKPEGLETPTSPEMIHTKHWKGPIPFQKKRVLIIGGATSAIEIAETLAKEHISVTLSTRKKDVYIWPQRLFGHDLHEGFALLEYFPRWIFGSFCQKHPTVAGTDLGFKKLRDDGKIKVLGEVERFEGKQAFFKAGEVESFETVLLATGYQHCVPFLPESVRRTPAGYPLGSYGQSRDWPGLFFMGLPCAHSVASEFLRGIAQDGPLVARQIKKRLQNKKL